MLASLFISAQTTLCWLSASELDGEKLSNTIRASSDGSPRQSAWRTVWRLIRSTLYMFAARQSLKSSFLYWTHSLWRSLMMRGPMKIYSASTPMSWITTSKARVIKAVTTKLLTYRWSPVHHSTLCLTAVSSVLMTAAFGTNKSSWTTLTFRSTYPSTTINRSFRKMRLKMIEWSQRLRHQKSTRSPARLSGRKPTSIWYRWKMR